MEQDNIRRKPHYVWLEHLINNIYHDCFYNYLYSKYTIDYKNAQKHAVGSESCKYFDNVVGGE